MVAAFVKVVGTNSISTTGTTIAVTVPAGGVASGNFVVVVPNGNGNGAISTVSDSKGNTYTVDRASTSTTGGQFASAPITTPLVSGDTITLVGTTSITSRLLTVVEFSGVSGADTGINNSSSVTAGTSITSLATPTTTQADEVLVGLFGTSGSTDTYASLAAGWTEASRLIGTSRTSLVAYQIVSATGTFTIGGTTNTAVDLRAALQAYKASAGGGGSNFTQTPTDALGLTDTAAPALASPWSWTYGIKVGQ